MFESLPHIKWQRLIKLDSAIVLFGDSWRILFSRKCGALFPYFLCFLGFRLTIQMMKIQAIAKEIVQITGRKRKIGVSCGPKKWKNGERLKNIVKM